MDRIEILEKTLCPMNDAIVWLKEACMCLDPFEQAADFDALRTSIDDLVILQKRFADELKVLQESKDRTP